MTAPDQSNGSAAPAPEELPTLAQESAEQAMLQIGARLARMIGTAPACSILRDVASQLEHDAAIRQAH